MYKKLISIILTVLLLLMLIPSAAFGTEEPEVPVIIVGGYSSTQLFYADENGSWKIWSLNFDYLHEEFVQYESEIIKSGIRALTRKDYLGFVNLTGGTVAEYVEKLAMNPDGTSKHTVTVYENDPATMNLAYLLENGPEDAIKEQRIISLLESRISDKNIFMFNTDWRQNAVLCANDLAQYVKAVKAFTGSEKVSIFGESHGGEVIAAYLSICSMVDRRDYNPVEMTNMGIQYKNFMLSDVDNTLLYCPAMGGVELCADILKEFNINLSAAIDFATNCNGIFPWNSAYSSEYNLSWLAEEIPVEFADIMATAWMEGYVYQYLITFGSIWDFLPVSSYYEYRDAYVAENGLTLTIERSDFMHNMIMGTYNYNKNLTYAINNGVQVSIVAGYSNTLAIGDTSVSSDGLVAVHDATGANVTDMGMRYSNGYTTPYGSRSVLCTDFSHNHVSPDMTLDAAYGYLPENTWFVEDLWHAQYASEDYTYSLVDKLLFEDVESIYSYTAFPQFQCSTNEQFGVYAKFNSSASGYLSSADSALYIKNLSSSAAIEITSTKARGMEFSASCKNLKLKPGESAAVTFKCSLPQTDMTNVLITIHYINSANVSAIKSRSLNFTVRGGEAVLGDISLVPVYSESVNSICDFYDAYGFFALIKAFFAQLARMLTIFRNITF